jgi:hypothetical protein
MSLSDYKQTLKQWGLSANPFDCTPPDEFAQVARVWYQFRGN